MKRLILLGFLALVGCEGQGKGSSSYEAYAEQIRAEGVAAFNAGIPPNANPRMRYSDDNRSEVDKSPCISDERYISTQPSRISSKPIRSTPDTPTHHRYTTSCVRLGPVIGPVRGHQIVLLESHRHTQRSGSHHPPGEGGGPIPTPPDYLFRRMHFAPPEPEFPA
jgi:hypothetical protein